MALPRLRILYATVSGTARQVAEAIELECSHWPAQAIEVRDMLEINGVDLDTAGPVLLLCIATTGSGDVPDDGQMLLAQLASEPRYLGGLRYGLIALGDSSYGSTFCGGGLRFDAVLQDLGAERIGDLLQLDATEDRLPEDAAVGWFRVWRETAGLSES